MTSELLEELARATNSEPDDLRARLMAAPVDLDALPVGQRFLAALGLTACGENRLAEALKYLPARGPTRHAAVGLRSLVAWPEGCDPLKETDAAQKWLARVELVFDGDRYRVEATAVTE